MGGAIAVHKMVLYWLATTHMYVRSRLLKSCWCGAALLLAGRLQINSHKTYAG